MFLHINQSKLVLVQGDITLQQVDAIVNAANSDLAGGGGVDGAIHDAAGPDLLTECRALGGCATGSAKITKGYRLPARHVIHAVGPVWRGGESNEEDLLASCYRTAIALANTHRLFSIAFPSISTGAFRFPQAPAARIAVGTVVSELSERRSSIGRVVFCCFNQGMASSYQDTFAELGLA